MRTNSLLSSVSVSSVVESNIVVSIISVEFFAGVVVIVVEFDMVVDIVVVEVDVVDNSVVKVVVSVSVVVVVLVGIEVLLMTSKIICSFLSNLFHYKLSP